MRWTEGGLGGIPPALQILGEISSNFFERTPPDDYHVLFAIFGQLAVIKSDSFLSLSSCHIPSVTNGTNG